MMARRWTQTEDTAVRLAAALDYEDGASVCASLLTGSVGPRRRFGSGRRGCARSSSSPTACSDRTSPGGNSHAL